MKKRLPLRVANLLVGLAGLCLFVASAVAEQPLDTANTSSSQSAASDRTERLLSLLREQEWDAAVEHAKISDGTAQVDMRWLAALVKTARSTSDQGMRDASAEIYHLAAETAATLVEEELLPLDKAAAIWCAAAKSLTAAERNKDALSWLALSLSNDIGKSGKQLAAKCCLTVASGLLDQGELKLASQAYGRAGEILAGEGLATARLGLAWTLVLAGDQNEHALDAVNRFLTAHPNHIDSPSAHLLRITSLRRLERTPEAITAQDELITTHPQSQAAIQALVAACQSQPFAELSGVVTDYLVTEQDRILESSISGSNLDVLAAGIAASVVAGQLATETLYAQAIAVTDQTGQTATRVLDSLQRSGRDGDAERIALRWIAPKREPTGLDESQTSMIQQAGCVITRGAREAACRWAGRTQRWSMIAMAAAEELKTSGVNRTQQQRIDDEQILGRSLHVDRLFAEALLQVGNPEDSLKLWQAIVDQGGADDFPTLLRLAETAVAAGSVTEASQRIASAGAAKIGHGDNDLINLLKADLQVRQLNFDRGRSLLEQVVRSSTADDHLRGRAQWMIGETHFMQEDFTEAIAAYRQVEGISKSPQWIAASLVQAGKSFEKLGKTREAMVCYNTLVQQHGGSPHAGGARARLAAITKGETTPPTTLRR